MMGQPVIIVDEFGRPYTTEKSLFVTFPLDLFTDGGDGESRRLRVDTAQTGFFAGREFRSFFEFDMSGGDELVVRAIVPIDVVLFAVDTVLTSGELRLETVSGGTEGGAFGASVDVFPRNNMLSRPTPIYSGQVELATGGSHTGGTVIDVLLNKTASNANFSSSVGASTGDERGVAPGTYYFRLSATGSTKGVFKLRWEERP